MLLESSYQVMRDGKWITIAAPTPSVILDCFQRKDSDSDESPLARLAILLSDLSKLKTLDLFGTRAARTVRLLLTPSFPKDIRDSVLASGAATVLFDSLPLFPRSAAFAECAADVLLRLLASSDVHAAVQFLIDSDACDQLVAWTKTEDLDLKPRVAILIESLANAAARDAKLTAQVYPTKGWSSAVTWARSLFNRYKWDECALPNEERERLRALGPQKMIAD